MKKKKEYKIQSMPLDDRPRERLVRYGPDVLKNAELLAIILNTGYRDESVLELASRILQEYGSRAITKEKDVKRLMEEAGIPIVKSCQIIACFEIGRRFFMEDTNKMPTIRDAEDVYRYLDDLRDLKKEQFRGLYLNSRNKLIYDEVISIGTLTKSLIHSREIFRPAIEFSSAAVILSHNHPSGDPSPSEKDIRITKQFIEVGKIIGIEVLDHVIIGKDKYTSLRSKLNEQNHN